MALVIPSPQTQAAYFATGGLAAFTAAPIDATFASATSTRTFKAFSSYARTHAPAQISRASFRFWTFVFVKHGLAHRSFDSLPTWLKGGLAGGAGGLAEVVLHNALIARSPIRLLPVLDGGARTFCGFSTFTYLWSTRRPDANIDAHVPPRPFARCWAYAATAGAVATALVGSISGARGIHFWMIDVPRGAGVVGTTIAVQVWTAGWLLQRFDLPG